MQDLSFLIEVTEEAKENSNDVKEILSFKGKSKYKISALTREDFKDAPHMLKKYFRNNNTDLDRFHIPELSKKEYEDAVKGIKNLKKHNKVFETASDYYIRKVKKEKLAADFGCSPKQIDLSDYIWDERFYIRYNFYENMKEVDDWYRDHGEDERFSGNAYKTYITEDPRTATMDIALYDELYSFCVATIKCRKAMLFGKVDKCLSALKNIAEYTYGFTQNPTRTQMQTLRNYFEYFKELLSDAEFVEFIDKYNDIKIFGADEATRGDYIETYKGLVKSLISGLEEDIADLKDILNTLEDPYIGAIIEPNLNVVSFNEAFNSEEDEEDTLEIEPVEL